MMVCGVVWKKVFLIEEGFFSTLAIYKTRSLQHSKQHVWRCCTVVVLVWALWRGGKLRAITPPATSETPAVQGIVVPIYFFLSFEGLTVSVGDVSKTPKGDQTRDVAERVDVA